MISDIRTYDTRLSDEREVLVATLDEEPVEVRFEKITDEVETEYDHEDAWRLAEAWNYRRDTQHRLSNAVLRKLCELLTQEGYGRFYDGGDERVAAWDPAHRDPDDELVEVHDEYVRARIGDWATGRLRHEDEIPQRCRRLADEYDVDLPQEAEA
jgi:hypothetical protein